MDNQSQQILTNILDLIPHNVFWKDRDYRYRGCNKRFAQQCGVDDPSELLGKTDADLFPPRLTKKYNADDNKIFITAKPRINYEEPHQLPDGKQLTVLVSKFPLFGVDRHVEYILCLFRPVPNEIIKLSTRERQCAFFILRGKSAKEIARALNLSCRTVEAYIDQMKTKMAAQTRSELFEKLYALGFDSVTLHE